MALQIHDGILCKPSAAERPRGTRA
jgi:hypothetical protein